MENPWDVMHALGDRMWGFTQELFDDPAGPTAEAPPEAQAAMFQQMAQRYPKIVEVATAASHDDGSVVGHGCDDQFEFEFPLDLLLTASSGFTNRTGHQSGQSRTVDSQQIRTPSGSLAVQRLE